MVQGGLPNDDWLIDEIKLYLDKQSPETPLYDEDTTKSELLEIANPIEEA